MDLKQKMLEASEKIRSLKQSETILQTHTPKTTLTDSQNEQLSLTACNIDIDEQNKKFIDALLKIKGGEIDHDTIIICGGTGCGKTYPVKRIFKDYYFCTEGDFKQRLTANQLKLRGNDEFGSDINLYPLEALAKLDCVIYDDYGVADITPAYIEKMMYWLDKRIGKKTIITSNMSLDQLKKHDERISSRIFNNSIILKVNGPDRRLKNVKVIEC